MVAGDVMNTWQAVALGVTITLGVAAIMRILWQSGVKPNIKVEADAAVKDAVADQLEGLHKKLDKAAAALAQVQEQAAEAVKQLTVNGGKNSPATAKDDLSEIRDLLTQVVTRQDETDHRLASHMQWSEEYVRHNEERLDGKADRP